MIRVMCCLVSLVWLAPISLHRRGNLQHGSIHEIAQDNPGGCVLTHLQERQTEQVYLNSLVLPSGWWICLVPQAPEKGLKSVIAKVEVEESFETGLSESNFGERWGERSRLTIVSEAVVVGSAKSLRGLICGAFSRFSGEQKNWLPAANRCKNFAGLRSKRAPTERVERRLRRAIHAEREHGGERQPAVDAHRRARHVREESASDHRYQ